jgi:hypothetical protein
MLPNITLIDRHCSSSKQLGPHWLFFSIIFFRFFKLSLYIVFFHCSLLFLYSAFLSHKIFPYIFCNRFSFRTVTVARGWRTKSCFEIQIYILVLQLTRSPIFETKSVTNLLISKSFFYYLEWFICGKKKLSHKDFLFKSVYYRPSFSKFKQV